MRCVMDLGSLVAIHYFDPACQRDILCTGKTAAQHEHEGQAASVSREMISQNSIPIIRLI